MVVSDTYTPVIYSVPWNIIPQLSYRYHTRASTLRGPGLSLFLALSSTLTPLLYQYVVVQQSSRTLHQDTLTHIQASPDQRPDPNVIGQ